MAPASGTSSLLLDGQQRVTTLYGIVRGTPPPFFEGDPAGVQRTAVQRRDRGVRVLRPGQDEGRPALGRRHRAVRRLDPPRWCPACTDHPALHDYVDRLLRVRNVLDREVHVERITGADKTVDVVVDIFNRVNSGGTKLSKGDLALARICCGVAATPARRCARSLDRWRAQRGLQFTPDWLLRNVNAVATGRAPFSALEDVSAGEFRDALGRRSTTSTTSVDLSPSALGLDHDRVLMGRYALPVVSRRLLQRRRPVRRRRRGGPRALLVRPRRGARSLRGIDRDASWPKTSKPSTATGSTASSTACGVPATAA